MLCPMTDIRFLFGKKAGAVLLKVPIIPRVVPNIVMD
jgi:hypothetical protein